MVWGFTDGSFDYLEWTQLNSPLSQQHVDMKPSTITHGSGDLHSSDFKGLSMSDTQNTLLDGTTAIDTWWYSVGYSNANMQGSLQPAYQSNGGVKRLAQTTELLIQLDATDAWQPERNKFMETIQIMYRQWSISFLMMPDSKEGSSWLNLLHFGTASGTGYGANIISIYFRPSDAKLMFYGAVSSNGKYSFETDISLPMSQWTTVEVSQMPDQNGDFVYSILINGNVVHSTINTDTQNFNNVNVYGGNDETEPAPVWIRTLTKEMLEIRANFENCEDFGECSVTCGSGIQTCQRKCVGGQIGDAGCEEEFQFNKKQCFKNQCELDSGRLCATLDYNLQGKGGTRFQVIVGEQPRTAKYPYSVDIPSIGAMSNQFSAVTVEVGCLIELYDEESYNGPLFIVDAMTEYEAKYEILTDFDDKTSSFMCHCGESFIFVVSFSFMIRVVQAGK